jgi:hypothetical protein
MQVMEGEENQRRVERLPQDTIVVPSTEISETPLPQLINPNRAWMRSSGLTFSEVP